jgi:hypothetical protein
MRKTSDGERLGGLWSNERLRALGGLIEVKGDAGAEEDFEEEAGHVIPRADVLDDFILEGEVHFLVSIGAAQVDVTDFANGEVESIDAVETVGGFVGFYGVNFLKGDADVGDVGAAFFAFDDVEFAEIEADEFEVEVSPALRFARVFEVNLGDIQEWAAAEFGSVVEDDVLGAEDWAGEFGGDGADLYFHARGTANLGFGDVFENCVFEEEQRDEKDDAEDQEAKGPTHEKLYHGGRRLRFLCLGGGLPGIRPDLPRRWRDIVRGRRGGF